MIDINKVVAWWDGSTCDDVIRTDFDGTEYCDGASFLYPHEYASCVANGQHNMLKRFSIPLGVLPFDGVPGVSEDYFQKAREAFDKWFRNFTAGDIELATPETDREVQGQLADGLLYTQAGCGGLIEHARYLERRLRAALSHLPPATPRKGEGK